MKVYLVEPIHPSAYEYLNNHCEITDCLSDCDGLITRNFAVDQKLMDEAKNLKVIGVHGTGIDGVDIPEAKRRKIRIYNAPNMNSLSVAEMNVALMLMLAKNSKKAINYYPNDVLAPISLMGREISNKVVGFVGLGNIALKTAKMLHFGFDCEILGYDLYPKNIDYIQEVTLEKLLAKSDYVLVAVSLNEKTKGLVNKEFLDQMKKDAYLINTTRGPIVNEDDLIEALKEEKIAGYGSDVFKNEPAVDLRFFDLNVVMSPHIAASTDEALYRVGMATVKQMVQALNQEEVEYEL